MKKRWRDRLTWSSRLLLGRRRMKRLKLKQLKITRLRIRKSIRRIRSKWRTLMSRSLSLMRTWAKWVRPRRNRPNISWSSISGRMIVRLLKSSSKKKNTELKLIKPGWRKKWKKRIIPNWKSTSTRPTKKPRGTSKKSNEQSTMKTKN